MAQRYDKQNEPDGSWSVVDVFTGQPALFDGAFAVGMDIEEADELLNLLNSTDIRDRNAKGIT
jgi:hypothetical protein